MRREEQVYALKAATRHAVKMAGGCESAAQVVNRSKSSLSNYGNPDKSDCIPIDAVLDLEQDIGEPAVTRSLARLQGYSLVPNDDKPPHVSSLDELLLDAAKELGEAVDVIRGREQFDFADYTRAEKEAREAVDAAQRVLDEVQKRRPGVVA